MDLAISGFRTTGRNMTARGNLLCNVFCVFPKCKLWQRIPKNVLSESKGQ
jgi:hypothetical protein